MRFDWSWVVLALVLGIAVALFACGCAMPRYTASHSISVPMSGGWRSTDTFTQTWHKPPWWWPHGVIGYQLPPGTEIPKEPNFRKMLEDLEEQE